MRTNHKRSFVVASIVVLMKLLYKVSGKTLLSKNHQKNKPYIPKDFENRTIQGMSVYESLTKESTFHLLYLHGGAYVHYGQKLHFDMLKAISKKANINIHYIDYPLAPESTVVDTTSQVISVIKQIQDEYTGTFLLAGDSSGGGLALAILNQLSNITATILLSPWLDVSVSNPDVKDSDYNEGFYLVQELRDCGTKYAPNQEQTPLASPLYLETLPDVDIHMFAGSEDLLSPDILDFEKRFPQVALYYYYGAPHVFPIFPHTKEQQHLISIIQSYERVIS